MLKNQLRSLPVLMYHHVSNCLLESHSVFMYHHVVTFPPLLVSPARFDEQCRVLAEQGWFGISLEEAEGFLVNGEPLPPGSFLMTFDGGYLDNYIYAWPIMREYGHKGVIFAVGDKIEAAEQGAKTAEAGQYTPEHYTLDDLWAGRCTEQELLSEDSHMAENSQAPGAAQDIFLNWDEVRELERSGVFSIAAHSLSHQYVFTGEDYCGFADPATVKGDFWQIWPKSCWGLPNFIQGPALTNLAFLPESGLVSAIEELVPQNESDARAFFKVPANVEKLEALVGAKRRHLGTFETQAGRIRRMGEIFEKTQAIFRQELGHKVKSFAWPWGAYTPESLRLAREAGFQVFYTTQAGINLPGEHQAVRRLEVKDSSAAWLLKRVRICSRPWLGRIYTSIRS
jgi:peptidoglycan/xylan/chitin deacetylase (PgdA/CDA1 family)